MSELLITKGEDSYAAKRALIELRRNIRHCAKKRFELKDLGIVPTLYDTMKMHKENPEILEHALDLLDDIVGFPEVNDVDIQSELIEKGYLSLALDALLSAGLDQNLFTSTCRLIVSLSFDAPSLPHGNAVSCRPLNFCCRGKSARHRKTRIFTTCANGGAIC